MKFQNCTEEHIILNNMGPEIKVRIKHSNRAKRASIKIGLKGAELILPKNYKGIAGYKFLHEKELWIRKKLEYISVQTPIDMTTIPFFDKVYLLKYADTSFTNLFVTANTIHIHSLPFQHEDILRRFLKNKLLEEIIQLTAYFKQKYNLIFTSIKIMDNKSKWGSCSSKAALTFNWRLVFAPKKVLKYLVVHEMCHIKEMNHSQNFWELVKSICPDYLESRLWLRQNSYRLHQYLQSPTNYSDKKDIHKKLQQELTQISL